MGWKARDWWPVLAAAAIAAGTVWLVYAVWRSPNRNDLATFGSYVAAVALVAVGLIARAWRFRVRSADDLARAESFYGSLGCRTERLPAGTVRGLGEIVRAEDPLGFTAEFFAAAAHPERLPAALRPAARR